MQCKERKGIRGRVVRVGACLLVLAVGLIAVPQASHAQCTAGTMTFTSMGTQQFVDKTLSMLVNGDVLVDCTVGVASGPAFCGRTAMVARAGVMTTALPAAAACNFACNTTGGTCNVTINNSDGLPVELLDFSIAENANEADDQESEADDASESD